MKSVIVDSQTADVYEELIERCPNALMYHSLRYRNVLKKTVSGIQDRYMLAVDGSGNALGAIPAFVKGGACGPILNSLPFFGSHGGVVQPGADEEVCRFLLGELDGYARENGIVSMTIITPPMDPLVALYEEVFVGDLADQRISLINHLPITAKDVEQDLLSSYAGVRRRGVHRAERAGVVSEIAEPCEETLAFICDVNNQNMKVVGGARKEVAFYEAVVDSMIRGVDYQVYRARIDGVTVAALLVLKNNNMAEYFVPALLLEYKQCEPLVGLVHFALADATRQGCKYWNWGGTGQSMQGVYDFKKRWGAVEGRYYYHTRLYGKGGAGLLRQRPEFLLQEYPYFYALPFKELSVFRDKENIQWG